MLKFFRKYNKLILGVGFAFLMVVFLLPAGVSQLVGDPRGRPVFEYDGGVITQGDLNRASQELQFLSRMHPAFLSTDTTVIATTRANVFILFLYTVLFRSI